jgi:hypothetical protein
MPPGTGAERAVDVEEPVDLVDDVVEVRVLYPVVDENVLPCIGIADPGDLAPRTR